LQSPCFPFRCVMINAFSCLQSQSISAYWCWIVCLDICDSWMWLFVWFLVYCNMPNVRECFGAFNIIKPWALIIHQFLMSCFDLRLTAVFLQASWGRWGFLHKSCSTIHRWSCPCCTGLTYFFISTSVPS